MVIRHHKEQLDSMYNANPLPDTPTKKRKLDPDLQHGTGRLTVNSSPTPIFGTNRCQHYATVGEKLAEKFGNVSAPITPLSPPLPYNQMTFRFVTTKEVNSLIRLLKNNKPSGVPNLKTSVLKDALKILLIEFTYLINICLDKSYMPLTWKNGVITPIPKVGQSSKPTDYRPISVLPAVSKVLERAVHNQLVYFLDTNGILDNRQHGFRKDHSTLSAVFDVTQHMYNNMDKRHVTYCAFIDYSKAFDTLDHNILIKKLVNIGLSSPVIEWCRSYLCGRKQCVKNGNFVSDELGVNYGVPQGSILGPLFFIIYVNDLLSLFNESDPEITLYADDTVLYVSDDNCQSACDKLERGLSKLSCWCALNKLSVNVKKTKLLVVDPLKISQNYPCPKLNGQYLERIHAYNYLGISIDENLNFDKFLREKYGSINSRVHQLGHMRKYIEANAACLIYKQMILPLSDYADVMIRSGPQGDIQRLENLHERVIRIIDNRQHPKAEIADLQRIYNIRPISARQDEHLCSLMYRLSKIPRLLIHQRPRVHLRNRRKIKFKPYKRTYEKYLKSPLSRGISLWDRLPENVQKSTTKFKFKKCVQDIIY